MEIREIPIELVTPNPDQPRKNFDAAKLEELAASIRENGLMQPIKVRPIEGGKFMIVGGERRWRAHCILKERKHAAGETIRAVVEDLTVDAMEIQAIVENLQRADITPLEEARAYQRQLDKGISLETLARRLGIQQPWRITERTALLKLKPEYLALFDKGQISPAQAAYLAKLQPHNQEKLFALIRAGRCETWYALRDAAEAIKEAEAQPEMFAPPPEATKEQKEAVSRFERRVDECVRMICAGFKDGELDVLRKVAPHKCADLAQKVGLIGRHVTMIERELRKGAAQTVLVA